MSFEQEHNNGLNIREFHREKLLEPGWPGELSPSELAYVKSEIRKSPSLKRIWGFRPTAKRLSEKHIRDVARNGVIRKSKPVSASATRRQKPNR
ncbi:MAG: hypothetical protein J7L19_03095 [Dehalococcoidia bacterium]|nr:hypothetical protein [Dehalococcoidia bacterium]